MYADTDEDEMEDITLKDERGNHWKMVFNDIKRGIDNEKSFIHDKRWDVYMGDKIELIKVGCYM